MTLRKDIIKGLQIGKDDLVLEVGSGSNPVLRSDILCDRCGDGWKVVTDNRPFIKCDGQYLPFKGKSFDYIIAKQVLEHADDPTKFLNELMRVGRKGYIEVANPLREVLFAWDHRKYIVSTYEDGKLLIRRKVGRSPFGNLFMELNDPVLRDFISDHWTLFNYCIEWDGVIDYSVNEEGIDCVALARELDIDFSPYAEPYTDSITQLLKVIWRLCTAWVERRTG